MLWRHTREPAGLRVATEQPLLVSFSNSPIPVSRSRLYNVGVMIYDLLQILSDSWQDRPFLVVLSIVAILVLIYVIIDTHRHRRKRHRRSTHQPPERSNHRHRH